MRSLTRNTRLVSSCPIKYIMSATTWWQKYQFVCTNRCSKIIIFEKRHSKLCNGFYRYKFDLNRVRGHYRETFLTEKYAVRHTIIFVSENKGAQEIKWQIVSPGQFEEKAFEPVWDVDWPAPVYIIIIAIQGPVYDDNDVKSVFLANAVVKTEYSFASGILSRPTACNNTATTAHFISFFTAICSRSFVWRDVFSICKIVLLFETIQNRRPTRKKPYQPSRYVVVI